jgi:SAM-dependent methyltransferase
VSVVADREEMAVPDTTMSVEKQAEQAMGRVVEDLATAAGVAAMLLGVRLGLWSALAGRAPATAAEVAADAGLAEPFVREWLRSQAAGGYLDHEPRSQRFGLPAGLAAVLAVEDGGLTGALASQLSTWFTDLDALEAGLREGRGLAWQDRSAQNSEAMDAITRTVVCPALVAQWLPSMDGVVDRLGAGGRVADVGCGYGAAARAIAQAYPLAEVWGFDADEASVTRARRAPADGGSGRTRFEVATATTIPGGDYDLITYVDTLHDLGDPVGALARARAALAPGGAVLLVEPGAADRVEDNFTPPGRLFYAASALVCTPNALAQEGHALGALAGESALRAVAADAGFHTARRLPVEAPFNLLLELRA